MTPLSPRSLFISWQAPPLDMRNGEITFYAINVVEVATGTLTLWNTSDHFLTVEPLHPYYEYQVSVAAATVGLGPYSPERIVRMPEAGQ